MNISVIWVVDLKFCSSSPNTLVSVTILVIMRFALIELPFFCFCLFLFVKQSLSGLIWCYVKD